MISLGPRSPGWRLSASSSNAPHDRPRRRSPCDFLEPRFSKSRRDARPDKGVRCPLARGFDRVAFDDARAVRPGEGRGGFEHPNRRPLSPVRFQYEETRDRPHRLVIDRFQNAGPFEGRVNPSRRHGAPGDGLALHVPENPGRLIAARHDFLEGPLVRGALSLFPFLAREPPEHTPAPRASAPLAEELLEILPPFGCSGMDGDV